MITVDMLIFLPALSLLTHLVSRRISIENIDSFSSIASVAPARICLCLVFIDSWLFIFTSKCPLFPSLMITQKIDYCSLLGALLVFGIGLEKSTKMCSLGIILCLVFYASSKALIYAFLGEQILLHVFITAYPTLFSREGPYCVDPNYWP
jgi:hypothetical protein